MTYCFRLFRNIVFFSGLLIFQSINLFAAEEKKLHIYTWYEVIPTEVIKDFEKETGIQVTVDYYDANQALEAQLLTKSSGYDLVFPSAYPFMARQLENGLFQPLDKSLLTNWSHLDKRILSILEKADPGNNYAVPYFWGVTGIGYNAKDNIEKKLGGIELDSWGVLYKPENAKKLASCGIYLLDESVDLFSTALVYLGYHPNSDNEKELQEAFNLLLKVRPYVRRFDTYLAINDLANGEACAIQNWSGDVAVAQERAREAKKGVEIKFAVPKEGTPIWVDTIAIPIDAPHPKNANIFINYLMRPTVIAKITNETHFANANVDSIKYIDKEILDNPILYPPKDVVDRAYVSTARNLAHQRLLNRLMMKLKLGRK